MLSAMVLLCFAGIAPQDQTRTADNASAVLRLPIPFTSAQKCAMSGQAYLAGSSLGRDIGSRDRIKIVCVGR
jgi:hypothetical protein